MLFIFFLLAFHKMKYIRNQFVRTGSFMWWIFIFLIAGALLYWGITIMQWSWTGIFIIFIGVAILFRVVITISNRSKIRNIVLHEFEKRPEASIEEISLRTGISKRDVRAIILDMKMSMHSEDKISTILGKNNYILSQKEQFSLQQKNKYCQSCGTPISDNTAQYCTYCGATI